MSHDGAMRIQLDMFALFEAPSGGSPEPSRAAPNVEDDADAEDPRWTTHRVPSRTRARDIVRRTIELELRALEADGLEFERPRTRAECRDQPRPCPWVSCRHHLYLETTETGSVVIRFPGIEPHELSESCALDVADRGPLGLDAVGEKLGGMHMERVRQVEAVALDKARVTMAQRARNAPDPAELVITALWSLVERLQRPVTSDEILDELDVADADRAAYVGILRGLVARRAIRRTGDVRCFRFAPIAEEP